MKDKFAITFFSQFSSYLIQFVAFYLLFLKMEVSIMGIWAFLTSMINLGFLFIDIGIDTIYYQYSGKGKQTEYFGTYFFLKVSLIISNVLITLILITFLGIWDSPFIVFLLILLTSKILTVFTSIFLVNLKSKMKVFKAEIPFFVISLGRSLSTILLATILYEHFEPLSYLSISNLIFDICFFFIIFLFSLNEIERIRPKKVLITKYLIDIKPIIISSVILVITNNLGLLIIDYTFGHEALGYVSLTSNYIIPILLSISGSIITVYFTFFSHFLEKNNYTSIKAILDNVEKYLSIIYLTIIIVVILNGELIISIFLPNYRESIPILYIMIFLPFFVGVGRSYGYLLIAGKKQKISSTINSLTSILVILMMIFLIPDNFLGIQTLGLGIIGYALAQTIPYFFWNVANRYYSYKYLDIKLQKKSLMQLPIALVTILLSFGLKLFVLEKIFYEQIFLLIISTILSMGFFFILLIKFKLIKMDDFRFFRQLFKIKNYFYSLKEDFKKRT